MMNYDVFKQSVVEKFMYFMSEEYKSLGVKVHEVQKVNRVLDGISLSGEGLMISPTVYINDMYDNYLLSEDIDAVVRKAAESVAEHMKNQPKISGLEFDYAKDNIVFQLINTEQNRELLSSVPNREFKDLSVVYRLRKNTTKIYNVKAYLLAVLFNAEATMSNYYRA